MSHPVRRSVCLAVADTKFDPNEREDQQFPIINTCFSLHIHLAMCGWTLQYNINTTFCILESLANLFSCHLRGRLQNHKVCHGRIHIYKCALSDILRAQLGGMKDIYMVQPPLPPVSRTRSLHTETLYPVRTNRPKKILTVIRQKYLLRPEKRWTEL